MHQNNSPLKLSWGTVPDGRFLLGVLTQEGDIPVLQFVLSHAEEDLLGDFIAHHRVTRLIVPTEAKRVPSNGDIQH